MNKHRLFAPFLTLFAVAVAYFTMLFFGYELKEMLIILLVILIVFYIAGSLIQRRINKFVFENEEKLRLEEEENGAVIEKDAQDESGEGSQEEAEEGYTLPPLTGEQPVRPGESDDDGFSQ